MSSWMGKFFNLLKGDENSDKEGGNPGDSTGINEEPNTGDTESESEHGQQIQAAGEVSMVTGMDAAGLTIKKELIDEYTTSQQTPLSAISQETPQLSTSQRTLESSTSQRTLESSTSQQTPGSSTSQQTLESSTPQQTPQSSTSQQTPGSSTSQQTPGSSTSQQTLESSTSQRTPASHQQSASAQGTAETAAMQSSTPEKLENHKETEATHMQDERRKHQTKTSDKSREKSASGKLLPGVSINPVLHGDTASTGEEPVPTKTSKKHQMPSKEDDDVVILSARVYPVVAVIKKEMVDDYLRSVEFRQSADYKAQVEAVPTAQTEKAPLPHPSAGIQEQEMEEAPSPTDSSVRSSENASPADSEEPSMEARSAGEDPEHQLSQGSLTEGSPVPSQVSKYDLSQKKSTVVESTLELASKTQRTEPLVRSQSADRVSSDKVQDSRTSANGEMREVVLSSGVNSNVVAMEKVDTPQHVTMETECSQVKESSESSQVKSVAEKSKTAGNLVGEAVSLELKREMLDEQGGMNHVQVAGQSQVSPTKRTRDVAFGGESDIKVLGKKRIIITHEMVEKVVIDLTEEDEEDEQRSPTHPSQHPATSGNVDKVKEELVQVEQENVTRSSGPKHSSPQTVAKHKKPVMSEVRSKKSTTARPATEKKDQVRKKKVNSRPKKTTEAGTSTDMELDPSPAAASEPETSEPGQPGRKSPLPGPSSAPWGQLSSDVELLKVILPQRQADLDKVEEELKQVAGVDEDFYKLREMFPDQNPAGILDFLRAHLDDPERCTKFASWVLMKVKSEPAGDDVVSSRITPSCEQENESNEEALSQMDHLDDLTRREYYMDILKTLFPDCEPSYFYTTLLGEVDLAKIKDLVTRMFRQQDYPQRTLPPEQSPRAVDEACRTALMGLGEDLEEAAGLHRDVEVMKALFPDCQPTHIFSRLQSMRGHPQHLLQLIVDMWEADATVAEQQNRPHGVMNQFRRFVGGIWDGEEQDGLDGNQWPSPPPPPAATACKPQ